jgi:hypothetical protein
MQLTDDRSGIFYPILSAYSEGPIIEAYASKEVVYAKDQPEYIPLHTIVLGWPRAVTSRWTLTPEQRDALLSGRDLYLEMLTFGHALQPVRLYVATEEEAATIAGEHDVEVPSADEAWTK